MLALIWVRQSVRCKYVQKHSFVEDHVSPVYILLLFCLGAAPLKQTACNRRSLQLVHQSVFQGFNLWNKKVLIFTCAGTNETCSTRNRAYLNKLNTPLSSTRKRALAGMSSRRNAPDLSGLLQLQAGGGGADGSRNRTKQILCRRPVSWSICGACSVWALRNTSFCVFWDEALA